MENCKNTWFYVANWFEQESQIEALLHVVEVFTWCVCFQVLWSVEKVYLLGSS